MVITQIYKNLRVMSWKTEKEKFLNMPLDKIRTVYRSHECISLPNIPTWANYFENKKAELAKGVPVHKDFVINTSKNEEVRQKVSIFRGDITTLEVDAIVNAANSSLLGGGGVDGAIHRAAGPDLKSECETLNGCHTGEAKLSGGYKLPAKYVIHTVGPKGENAPSLKKCYESCLKIMTEHQFKSIAFPCISTGIYGYPLWPAAHIATSEVRNYLEHHHDKVDRIIFCLFSNEDVQIYEAVMQGYFPV